MPELLIPADVELAVKRELDASLVGTVFAGARIGTKIPTSSPKPPRFVRVVASGGGERDLVTDNARTTLDAFCVDEGEASDLAALCLAVVQRAGRVGALGGIPCYGVDVAALPANLPHPTVTTHHRYTVTISAALRRAAA